MRRFAILVLTIALACAAVAGPTKTSKKLKAAVASSAAAGGSTVPTNRMGPPRTGTYPAIDLIPDVSDPQVKLWVSKIDLTQVPKIPQSTMIQTQGVCPAAATLDPNYCWWSCQKCTRPTDVLTCPEKNTWGVSYDDGPSPYTPQLLELMTNISVKGTFFVVGSRCAANPTILQDEIARGHQVAIHTWSHHYLTSLSNEQIVAELMWTQKCIFDVTGYVATQYRPPFGDVDDRVRYIANQLGMQTVIWTEGFDTNDWTIGSNGVTEDKVLEIFQSWIPKIPTMDHGFLVLEHDLYEKSVAVGMKILPMAKAANIIMLPINECIHEAGYSTTMIGGNGTAKIPPQGLVASGKGGATTSGPGGSSNPTAGGATAGASFTAPSSFILLLSALAYLLM